MQAALLALRSVARHHSRLVWVSSGWRSDCFHAARQERLSLRGVREASWERARVHHLRRCGPGQPGSASGNVHTPLSRCQRRGYSTTRQSERRVISSSPY
jgi:hypothetical protein